MKRILSGILALLMVVSMMPVQAFATENEPDTTVEAVAVEATKQTTVPTEADTEPVEETTVPTEVGTEPEKETTVPTEAEAEPEKETTVPTEAETEPVEETTVPTEAETEPVEETIVPTEAEEEPAEETTVPTEETEPVEKTASTEEMIIPVESVTIFQKENLSELIAEDTMQLTATVLPENATEKTVVWSSSDETVATVDNNGVVTAVAEGSVSIIAECAGKMSDYSVIVLAKDPANRDISSENNINSICLPANSYSSLPSSIFLKQQSSVTCTLASAAMMLRSVMYRCENIDWEKITETSIKSTAWTTGGLKWNWTYTLNGNSITVDHKFVSGISVSSLKSLLKSHPEGIVIYCGNAPHAVFAFEYEGDIFYCADPAGSFSGKRISLDDSYLGYKYYSSQADILKNVTAYWYVSSYSINPSKESVAVTFNPNGGSCSESTRTVEKGKSIGSLPTPTRSGYSFKGWYTATSGGTKVTSSTVVNGNMTLYAQWDSNVNSVDLGQDFYAFIKFKSGGNGLSNVNGNVELGVYEQTESLWRFVLNDDDTYTIESAVDGKMMDVCDNSSEDGTNIWTYPANGTEAQKWYITWTGSGYSLISAGSYKALDIGYGRTDIGANVQLWEANGSEAQLFDINIVYSPAITPFDNYHEMTIGETDSIETRFNVSWSRDYVQDLDYGVSVSCDEALDCGWTYQDGDNWTMVINARKAGTYTVTALLYNSDWSEVIDECDITVKVTDPNAGAICTNHNFVNHVCKKCGAKSAKITGQTSKISTPENCEVTFNVDATGDGLYYNWYYAEPGWETFYYVEGVSGNSYTFTVSKDMDGYRFLCAVHDAYGNYEFTGVMTLEIVTSVKITQQPKSVTVAEGATAKVTVKATGDGLTYRWYYKDAGKTSYTYTSSFKSNTYSVTMNEARNGRRVLCKVYDKYGNMVQSASALLSMQKADPVKITAQPVSVTVAEGATAKVTVKATGDDLTYRWYYKDAGKSSYIYTSSFKSNTYSVTMNEARNGRRVLCKVYDKYGNMVQSNSALLSMKQTVKITQQPKSVIVAEGATAKVTVKATGDGLTYRWYYKDAGKSSYTYTSSFKSNTYSVTMNAARNGRRVLCKVYDKYGNMVQSSSALLSMK